MGWDNVLRVHISVVMRLATVSGRHIHNLVSRQGREAYRHKTLSTTTLSQLFYSESPIPSPENQRFVILPGFQLNLQTSLCRFLVKRV